MMPRIRSHRESFGLSLPLLLLALAGFGATTILLSASLINSETSFVESPAAFVDRKAWTEKSVASSNRRMEEKHVKSPWAFRLRARGVKNMDKVHRRQRQSTHAQSPTAHPNRTMSNPCGKSNVSISVPNKCAEYNLPFSTSTVPKECWPRIVLLPSYPTSGNELVHVLFQRITGLITLNSVNLGEPAFDLSTDDHDGLTMYYDDKELCASNLTLPNAGQVVLSKNHYRNQRGGPNPNLFESSIEQKSGEVPGGVAAVVRLARNPGDHLLRNFFRWDNRDCHGDECFFRRARSTCPMLAIKANDWNIFHAFWDSYDASVPQMVMHYEHFSQRDLASTAFQEMMDFVGATEQEPGTMIQKVQDFVREPTYERGGLVARVCGVEVARRIHRLTKEYSEKLGYGFDSERGIWTLSNRNIHKMVS